MSPRHRQAGIGLIEVLITLLVISVGLIGHVTFQRVVFHSSTLATARATATQIAMNKLEDLRGFTTLHNAPGKFAFQDIADNTGGTLQAGTVTADNTTYTRHWSATNYWYTGTNEPPANTPPSADPLPDLKQVTITVGWTDIDGKAQTINLSSLIAASNPGAANRLYK